MKRLVAMMVVLGAAALVSMARGGHELPIYPSFYPHEIEIRSLAPGLAAQALRDGSIQAYVGRGLSFSGALPPELQAIESLGSFIVVRTNPASPRARDDAAACAVVATVMRGLTGQSDFVAHPYPVTPFHGHMVSGNLWPGLLAGLLSKDAATDGSKRPFLRCHFAHNRSTLQ